MRNVWKKLMGAILTAAMCVSVLVPVSVSAAPATATWEDFPYTMDSAEDYDAATNLPLNYRDNGIYNALWARADATTELQVLEEADYRYGTAEAVPGARGMKMTQTVGATWGGKMAMLGFPTVGPVDGVSAVEQATLEMKYQFTGGSPIVGIRGNSSNDKYQLFKVAQSGGSYVIAPYWWDAEKSQMTYSYTYSKPMAAKEYHDIVVQFDYSEEVHAFAIFVDGEAILNADGENNWALPEATGGNLRGLLFGYNGDGENQSQLVDEIKFYEGIGGTPGGEPEDPEPGEPEDPDVPVTPVDGEVAYQFGPEGFDDGYDLDSNKASSSSSDPNTPKAQWTYTGEDTLSVDMAADCDGAAGSGALKHVATDKNKLLIQMVDNSKAENKTSVLEFDFRHVPSKSGYDSIYKWVGGGIEGNLFKINNGKIMPFHFGGLTFESGKTPQATRVDNTTGLIETDKWYNIKLVFHPSTEASESYFQILVDNVPVASNGASTGIDGSMDRWALPALPADGEMPILGFRMHSNNTDTIDFYIDNVSQYQLTDANLVAKTVEELDGSFEDITISADAPKTGLPGSYLLGTTLTYTVGSEAADVAEIVSAGDGTYTLQLKADAEVTSMSVPVSVTVTNGTATDDTSLSFVATAEGEGSGEDPDPGEPEDPDPEEPGTAAEMTYAYGPEGFDAGYQLDAQNYSQSNRLEKEWGYSGASIPTLATSADYNGPEGSQGLQFEATKPTERVILNTLELVDDDDKTLGVEFDFKFESEGSYDGFVKWFDGGEQVNLFKIQTNKIRPFYFYHGGSDWRASARNDGAQNSELIPGEWNNIKLYFYLDGSDGKDKYYQIFVNDVPVTSTPGVGGSGVGTVTGTEYPDRWRLPTDPAGSYNKEIYALAWRINDGSTIPIIYSFDNVSRYHLTDANLVAKTVEALDGSFDDVLITADTPKTGLPGTHALGTTLEYTVGNAAADVAEIVPGADGTYTLQVKAGAEVTAMDIPVRVKVSKGDVLDDTFTFTALLSDGTPDSLAQIDADAVTIPAELTGDITLPLEGSKFGSTLAWESDNAAIAIDPVTGEATVTRPPFTSGSEYGQATEVTLTLTATYGEEPEVGTAEKAFTVKVLPIDPTDEERVLADSANISAEALEAIEGNDEPMDAVTKNIILPVKGTYGSTITWESANADIIEIPTPAAGATTVTAVVKPSLEGDEAVRLTATVSYGELQFPVQIDVTVKQVTDAQGLADAAASQLVIATDVYGVSIPLPSTGAHNSTITWKSNNPDVVSDVGSVTPPQSGTATAELVATVSVTLDGVTATATRTFTVTVHPTEAQYVGFIKEDFNAMTPDPTIYDDSFGGKSFPVVGGENTGWLLTRPIGGGQTLTGSQSFYIEAVEDMVAEPIGAAADRITGNVLRANRSKDGQAPAMYVYRDITSPSGIVDGKLSFEFDMYNTSSSGTSGFAWVKLNSGNTVGMDNSALQVGFGTNNKTRLGSGSTDAATSGNLTTPAGWNHFKVDIDTETKTALLYINGVQQGAAVSFDNSYYDPSLGFTSIEVYHKTYLQGGVSNEGYEGANIYFDNFEIRKALPSQFEVVTTYLKGSTDITETGIQSGEITVQYDIRNLSDKEDASLTLLTGVYDKRTNALVELKAIEDVYDKRVGEVDDMEPTTKTVTVSVPDAENYYIETFAWTTLEQMLPYYDSFTFGQ